MSEAEEDGLRTCCFLPARANVRAGGGADGGNGSALDRVELRREGEAQGGRGLWASVALQAGEVLFANLPLAHVLCGDQVARRCSFCLSTAPEGASALSQCGKCKYVRYCDAVCQQADWSQHRVECPSLVEDTGTCEQRWKFSLLNACRQAGRAEEDMLRDTRLMLRVSSIFSAASDTACVREDDKDRETGVDSTRPMSSLKCGVAHLTDMCSSPQQVINTQEHAMVAKMVTHILSKGGKKNSQFSETLVLSLLCKFQANNFGITDDLLQCIGAGVFPASALLNHSCQPTCLLRYTITKRCPPSLAVVALPGLRAGEQLTHSYVDLAQPTTARQLKLKETYGFSCLCGRCIAHNEFRTREANKVLICKDFAESGSIEADLQLSLTSGTTSLSTPIIEPKQDTCISIDVESALNAVRVDSALVKKAFAEAGRWQRQAAVAGLADDALAGAREESRCLENALESLRGACGPFHFEVYKVHGQLMTNNLVTGNYRAALQYCYLVVGYLRLVYDDVPQHPLLGLQLFTLGDILSTQENRTAEALHTFRLSHEILNFAFGSSNSLVSRLEASISELERM